MILELLLTSFIFINKKKKVNKMLNSKFNCKKLWFHSQARLVMLRAKQVATFLACN